MKRIGFNIESFKEKIKNTLKEKYGTEVLSNSIDIEGEIYNTQKVNTNYNLKKSLLDFINGYCDIITNYKVSNYVVDVYLPKLGIAFDFNDLYSHSELLKDDKYHLIKTKFLLENGINLFHVWEDDWLNKTDIVRSMILNKIGCSETKIWARKCKVVEILDNRVVRDFLNRNHIQGFVGSKVKLGLYYQGELVSIMTFGNLRKSLGQISKSGTFELLRFCNKLNTTVVGGASKLFTFFVKNFEVREVLSYSDYSRSNGNMYLKLGFKLEHNSAPNYYYIIDGVRKHRFSFRKARLVSEGFNSKKTEAQIMRERGYYRIFDCGMQKWKYPI